MDILYSPQFAIKVLTNVLLVKSLGQTEKGNLMREYRHQLKEICRIGRYKSKAMVSEMHIISSGSYVKTIPC